MLNYFDWFIDLLFSNRVCRLTVLKAYRNTSFVFKLKRFLLLSGIEETIGRRQTHFRNDPAYSKGRNRWKGKSRSWKSWGTMTCRKKLRQTSLPLCLLPELICKADPKNLFWSLQLKKRMLNIAIRFVKFDLILYFF